MTKNDYQEQIYTTDIEDMIKAIINKHFKRPYPEDITDQVFLIIENNPNYLKDYTLYAGENIPTANQMIGKYVKQHTGLRVKGQCQNPQSKLIKSFTKLGL